MKALRLFVILLIMSNFVQAQNYLQFGTAGVYNAKTADKKTASGETLNQRKYTAAHQTLPFGTLVRVTNLSTGDTITVRINDRRKFESPKILHLTKAAAEQIGLNTGTIEVKLEVLSKGKTNKKRQTVSNTPKDEESNETGYFFQMLNEDSQTGYGIQIGAFRDVKSLNEASVKYSALQNKVMVFVSESSSKSMYKLIVGPFDTKTEALNYRKKLADVMEVTTDEVGILINLSEIK